MAQNGPISEEIKRPACQFGRLVQVLDRNRILDVGGLGLIDARVLPCGEFRIVMPGAQSHQHRARTGGQEGQARQDPNPVISQLTINAPSAAPKGAPPSSRVAPPATRSVGGNQRAFSLPPAG